MDRSKRSISFSIIKQKIKNLIIETAKKETKIYYNNLDLNYSFSILNNAQKVLYEEQFLVFKILDLKKKLNKK